jgi:hypothetical protein
LAALPGLGRENQEEKYMPYYHFVVRGPDYTYDDPDGTHFPNMRPQGNMGIVSSEN